MIHLDTSFLIRSLVRGSPEGDQLRAWLGRSDALGISSVAWAEFLCGPLDASVSDLARRVVGDSIAFDDAAARVTAELFNETGRRRGSLADCMVAAVAIQCDALLATTNPADFRRMASAGLRLATADS